jgi:hypothetical protein
VPAETGEIDGLVAAGHQEFGHGSAAAGRVHEAVAGEPASGGCFGQEQNAFLGTPVQGFGMLASRGSGRITV